MSKAISPQKENGYTPIANEIMDALIRTRISGEARQVLDFIIRKTYGYNKKSDNISISQFEKATGIDRKSTCRALNYLADRKLIHKGSGENATMEANSYSFNKHYRNWGVVAKTPPSGNFVPKGSGNFVPKVVAKTPPTKDIITKDNIQKTGDLPFFDELWARYPVKDGKKTALKHFIADVKTDQDKKDITIALENYINSRQVQECLAKGEDKYIKNGSTWFNNWRDWVDRKESVYVNVGG